MTSCFTLDFYLRCPLKAVYMLHEMTPRMEDPNVLTRKPKIRKHLYNLFLLLFFFPTDLYFMPSTMRNRAMENPASQEGGMILMT